MISGLTMPFVSEPDPDTMAEGSLDPLGLATIGAQLADLLAPDITARMSRIRFLTAIAAGSSVLGEPEAWFAEDGTPSYLAFEWLVVESFVRAKPGGALDRVPGIGLARDLLRDDRRHLNRGSYLKTPKVFGFFGVYKRLARDVEIVDEDPVVLARAGQLLDVWEREQGLDGFQERRSGTSGGRLAAKLYEEVARALDRGSVRLGRTSAYWAPIAKSFAPSLAGPKEKQLLWSLLRSGEPERTAYIDAIAGLPASIESERDAVEQIARTTSDPDLRARTKAVLAYEAVVRCLDDAFTYLRVAASENDVSAVPLARLAGHQVIRNAAEGTPRAFDEAMRVLDRVGVAAQLETDLGGFAESVSAPGFLEGLLARHDAVQSAKGARPWFERERDDLRVRGPGRLNTGFKPREELLHPYRVRAIRSFATDLGRASQA